MNDLPATNGRRPTVLIVDDAPDNITLMSSLLREFTDIAARYADPKGAGQ